MVVCKCRKATKLYCFVHKAPVCGECICSQEHKLCVVRTYSEWVIDGDYDWPPICPICNENLEEGDKPTVRLGCLHVCHSTCLERHLQSFPAHTAPAGYVCPACSTPVWPPKAVKETASALYTELKNALSRSEVASVVLASDGTTATGDKGRVASLSNSTIGASGSPRAVPVPASPSVASAIGPGPTPERSKATTREQDGEALSADVSTLDGLVAAAHDAEVAAAAGPMMSPSASSSVPGPSARQKVHPHPPVQAGPTGRRNSFQRNSTAIDMGDEDDEDVERKYARRGNVLQRLLSRFVPSWSSGPILPTTNPAREHPRADSAEAESLIAGQRRRGRRKGVAGLDARQLLIIFAVVSCMGTMMLLYVRLATSLLPSSTSNQAEEHVLP